VTRWLAEVTTSPSPSPVPGTGDAGSGVLVAFVVVTVLCVLIYWVAVGRHAGRRPPQGWF
jgi:hypothetical protein